MFYSLIKLRGAAEQQEFSFPFPYIKREDIAVTVGGAKVPFTFTSSNTISLREPLPVASDVVIRRTTERSVLLVDYSQTAELSEDDLDLAARQFLYIAQEALDMSQEAVVLDENGWDARNNRIRNVRAPEAPEDAVNKAYLEDALAENEGVLVSTAERAERAAENAHRGASLAQTAAKESLAHKESAEDVLRATNQVLVDALGVLNSTEEAKDNAWEAVVSAEEQADRARYWYDVFRSIYYGVRQDHPTGDVIPGAMYYSSSLGRLFFYNGTQWYSPTSDAERAEAARRFVESMRNEVSNMRDQVQVYSGQAQELVGEAQDAANAAARHEGAARNEAAVAQNQAIASASAATLASERATAADASAKVADAAAGRAEAAAEQVGETFGDRGSWYVAHGMPTKPMRSALWTVMDGGELNGVEWNVGDMLVYSIKTNSFGRITGASITPSEPGPIEAEEGVILGEGKFIRARVGANIRWLAHANSEGVKLGDNAVELHLLGNNMVFGALKHPVFHKGNLPSWDDVTGKPERFPVGAHAHKWDEITGKPAAALRWPTWFEVSDKPTYFPPVNHTHSWNEISNKPDTALRWPTAAEAGARPSDWVPSWGDVTGKPATATRWPTPAEVGAAVRIPLNLSSSTTGRRSCRLLTIGLTDNSASFMVTAQGDFGQRERGWYFVSIATRGSAITINTYLLNGFQADPLRLFWKNTGSAFEVWGEFSDYNNNNYLFPLGEHGATYNVDNIGTARDWTGFTEVAVNRIYTTNDKPTAADVGARPSNWVPTWDDVTGKPSTLPPAAHSHTASEVGAFPSSVTAQVQATPGVAWSASSGVYTSANTSDSDLVLQLKGSGSCPALQIKARYKNGGLWYRSARDSVGFEEGWTGIFTSKYPPTASDVKARPDNWVPSWGDITGKPSTFPAATHSHAWGDITGKPSTFPAATHSHAWGDITGKPSTFPATAHKHSWSELTGIPVYATRWPTASEAGAAALNHGHARQFGSEQTLTTEDLDTIKTPGVYAQHANANTSTARHYPENLAGSLTVTVGAGVQQRYHVYNTSRIWTRAQYDKGAWTAWAREYNTLNKPTAAEVGALPVQAAGGVLEVGKYIDFHDTGTSVDYSLRLMQEGTSLRVQGSNGYVDVGAKNTGYAHYYTDRPQHYFDKNVNVNDLYVRSDARLKSNLEPLSGALAKVCSLKGWTYDKKLTINSEAVYRRETGLIAQDVQKVLPSAVHAVEGDLLTLSSSALVALLVEAVKELSAKVEALEHGRT